MPEAVLIGGKELAAGIREEAARRVADLLARFRRPCLAVILVGEDPASKVYVKNKQTACEACGIEARTCLLPENTPQAALLELIAQLNADDGVDGILCQLPLPRHIDKTAVIDAIAPEKDADGFSPVNMGKLVLDLPGVLPCTPAGIIEMLRYAGIPIAGRRAVVLGRSRIVGKPVAALLMREDATVTVCHTKTADLPAVAREADILIAAVGVPRFVTAEMVKPGAAVIDVGIHRMPDGKLCGDVDFDAVKQVAGAISPVPGGVGPMTVAMLMKNTVDACARRAGI